MVTRDGWKENYSWISSIAAASCFFYRKGGGWRAKEEQTNIKFCLNSGKMATETHEMPNSVYGKKKLFLVCMSWSDLKDSLRDISSLRVMQGGGSLDCLKFGSGCKISWTGGERHWMTPKTDRGSTTLECVDNPFSFFKLNIY